jgi:16S rRNA (cytosine1402-N4)-methyltransferase
MIHTPVLVDEIISLFTPKPKSRLLDATLGTGGHTRAFLEAAGPNAAAVGLDADPAALTAAKEELSPLSNQVAYVNANFANLNDALVGGGIVEGELRSLPNTPPYPEMPRPAWLRRQLSGFTHILFDLGVGTHQLADLDRGFSFRGTGWLDMRYGHQQNLPDAQLPALNRLTARLGRYPSAADLIRGLAVDDLAQVLRLYGEERFAKRIARALHDTSDRKAAGQVAELVKQAVPARYEHGRLHPATRTFQALRLAVNRELEALAQALPQAVTLLTKGGIIAVISFHSLEDRMVKRFLRSASELTVLTKKPVRAGEQEVKANPRSRSAKLRAAKKIPEE